jgi:DNA phosphorothioation-dependent restriction protein DptH
MLKTLAASIARQHVDEDGLRALYVPDQLPHLAREIVRHANASRSSETSFSVLVSDDLTEDLSDTACPVVGMGRSIQYRRDDRLAVVCGAHSVPASFSSSFAAALEADYPGEKGHARAERLSALAGDAIDIVVEHAGINREFIDAGIATERLTTIFTMLAEAYERIAQGGDAWNVFWLRHVGSGLDVLADMFGADEPNDVAETADARLARVSYASFGLPTPSTGTAYGLGRKVDEALIEFWSTSESITLTLKRLRHHPSRPASEQGTPHELEGISFSHFGHTVAAMDNLLLAWGTPQGNVNEWVAAFSALSEGEFFAPEQGMDSALKVYTDRDIELGVAGEGSPQIVVFAWDDEAKELTSEPLRVVLPTSHIPDEQDVSTSQLTLNVSGSGAGKAAWVGTLVQKAGMLLAEGRIVLPRTGAFRMPGRPVSLSTSLPADDSLAGCAGSAVSSAIYPVVEGTVGVWTFEGKGTSDAFKPGVYRGYDTIEAATEDAGVVVPVESSVGTVVRTVTWGKAPKAAFAVREIRHDQAELDVRISDPDLVTTSEDEVAVGELVVRWRAGVSTDEFLSPLLAAARNGVVSAGEPDVEILHSFRGRVETYLSRFIDEATVLDALGHVAMFEDQADVPDALEAGASGAVLVPEGRHALFTSHIGFQVSAELRASDEVARFRKAIADLDLGTHLRRPGNADDRPDFVWPSRTSWAWAHQSAALEEYLDAYQSLIDRAASGTPQDVFWASFPFSVSLYRTDGTKKARAVMLSPLHPLRLAWLAAAEDSLRQADSAERLAGVLEAWNLPAVGPQSDSHNGRLLAIPVDAGVGQLFLGWSMLVAASVAGHEALEGPAQVGALPAPGTSVTGLNADAVRAALRTFHRMNPQVSTLSIDLASSTASPRLGEIDQAIIDAIAAPPGKSSLRGGVRVHDSMNRLGETPLADLERTLGTSSGRPVRWSRYKHQQTGGPQANMRFLQDAGVKVEVSPTKAPGSGRISTVPLRRFSTPAEAGDGHVALQFPIVEPEAESSAFVRALAKVERSDHGVQISAELFQAALVNDSADWTVTGESLVGANSLADMLEAHGSGQMLWEWRPPFLEQRSTPQLDARPFVSVVRLPAAVKNQISTHVIKASGSADDIDAKLADVMTTLGTRGIGLSSLMAHGGTHAAGAVGFYLTLRLLEKAAVPDAQLLVLPIDACDEFLRGLANESATTNQLRRADLLLVAVNASGVTLVPVEIKCYGLGSANPPETLPSSAAALKEALSQLESTSELLQQVVDSYRQIKGSAPAKAALWRHGFATMIEAAMRLRPAPAAGAQLLGSTLVGLLEGGIDVRLGRSMLCYFGHDAMTVSGTTHALQLELEAPGNGDNKLAGALVCNTQVAFDFVRQGQESIGADWQQLIEWVLAEDAIEEIDQDEAPLPSMPPPGGESAAEMDAGSSGDAPVNESAPPYAEAQVDVHESVEVELEAESEAVEIVVPTVKGIQDDGVRFEIGKMIDGVGAHGIDFWPSNTALNQMNVGVVGDLGTGKTQFLKSVVYQLRKGASERQPTPLSMLIFDYKRDYHDAEFLTSVGGELQRPFHIPLNVLAINGDYTPQKAVQAGGAFVDIITKIYGGIGPVQKSKVLMIIKDLFAKKGGSAPTLGEVLEAYLEENAFDSVAAVLNGFVLNEVFSEDQDELITMEQMLDDKVLVLAVSDLGADDNLKTALITLFLNKYYEYMLRLDKWPFEGEAPNQLRRLNSFVMVDEATNIMAHEFPVLSQLLLQGREFGVGVILASQYVSHFKVGKTNYGETLLTKVVHKVPNANVNDLKAFGFSGATPEMAAKVPNLAVHQALVKTLGVEARFMRGTPYFELKIDE